MIGDARARLDRTLATGRAGLQAPAEEIVVAGLVAAPFAGTFGIALSWLTWWPNPVIWAATALALAAGAAWVVGYRLKGIAE